MDGQWSTEKRVREATAAAGTFGRPSRTALGGTFRRAGRTGLALAAVVLSAAVWAGCDRGTTATGPSPTTGPTQFSERITLPELRERLLQGPVRLEIEVLPGGLVAREVEIEDPEDLFDDEKVESRIAAIDDAVGAVTLALGGLVVTYTDATRFRDEGRDLTRAEFVARVRAALDAGMRPPVEAKRRPAPEPQAPDDPAFVALELRLDDEADEPRIEINADGDNLVVNDAPPPDAWVAVLGLRIEIRAGVTELEAKRAEVGGRVEFEGRVAAVNPGAGTLTLADGTVIRIVAGTEIEDADDEDELGSLDAVAQALAAGLPVEAEGKGVLESATPRTIVAIEIEFELEDDVED
jgi:hypothetical protein